jgi:serpin B
LSLPVKELHSATNSLNIRLVPQVRTSDQSDDHPELNIANSIWLQDDFQILPTYLDLLAQYYGAGLHTVDFAHATETTRKAINEWVSRETQENIKDILPEGGLDPNTRLVLANAIYFKAKWVSPFIPSDTQNGPFTLLDGTQVMIPTMESFKPMPFPYTSEEGYQAIALPYQNSTIAMILLVPDLGRYVEFENNLTWVKFQETLAALHTVNVDLSMPKFDFETAYQLNRTFNTMGMTDAFDSAVADFSGITGGRDLFIGDIRHKAFITVDEYGTVAGAATMVAFPVSLTLADVELTIDRPFLFAIQDRSSGAILFLGRVLHP